MSAPIHYDNVFEVITQDPMELFDLTLRADLLRTILGLIRERDLTARQVGEILMIPAPRVSELMRGRIALLSAAKLVGYLGLFGYQLRPDMVAGHGVTCDVVKVTGAAA